MKKNKTMTYYNSTLGDIYYFYKKSIQNKPTIVFLPSFGGDNTYFNFKNIITEIKDTYGILAIDSIGYGNSAATFMERNPENIIQNYMDVINFLKIDNIIIIGHSLGAVYSLFLAKKSEYDIKLLFLIEPPHIGIKEDLYQEMDMMLKEFLKLNEMKKNKKISSNDFLNAINPHNSVKEQRENSEIFFNSYGNKSIISEANNINTIITELHNLNLSNITPNIVFLCSSSRELEYKHSPYNGLGEFFFLDGSHYLHWSNETELSSILNNYLV